MKAPTKLLPSGEPIIKVVKVTLSSGTVAANTTMSSTVWFDLTTLGSETSGYKAIAISSIGLGSPSFLMASFSIDDTFQQAGIKLRNQSSSSNSTTATLKVIMIREDWFGGLISVPTT